MTDDEFDDALDGLPLHKRNKVLRLVGQEERAPPTKLSFTTKFGRTLAFLILVVVCAPITMLGVLMIVSVVLAPFGFAVAYLGVWPLYRLIKGWIRQSVQQRMRDS